MKLIEGMKKIKDLQRKAADLRDKVRQYCVDYEHETPTYADQRDRIKSWLDSHRDILFEIENLKLKIQKTNIQTLVPITIDGNVISKSIAAWIIRRGQGKNIKGLAHEDLDMWSMLTDRGLKEERMPTSSGQVIEKKIRRYYDPAQRDRMKEIYMSEPQLIDSVLEVVNARTELVSDEEPSKVEIK